MQVIYQSVIPRAMTIDELLSDAYEALPGQKSHTDLAARRLAAWCRASASGDWSLFAQRLERDGLSIAGVLARFATVRFNASAPTPLWADDAVWIAGALQSAECAVPTEDPVAFEQLLVPVVVNAETLIWSDLEPHVAAHLTDGARRCLRRSLMAELSNLTAPAIYQRFSEAGLRYEQFVADMKADGFASLFDDKPVLLRLMASLTRQWIETSRELITRLDADLSSIRRDILHVDTTCPVNKIEGHLSDPHNFGRSVAIIGFEDGSRVVYKPKDLRVDAAWHTLIEKLNRSAPVDLRAVRVLPREGYGWTEFVDHTGCDDLQGFRRYFWRAGGLLALLHCFVGVDMHQENIIAAGADPVPIDLEMVLQAADTRIGSVDADDSGQAHASAMQTVTDSVMTVGLLPAYGRYSGSKIFAIGGVTSNSAPRVKLSWIDVNSDTMRPAKAPDTTATISNLPHVDGHHGRLGDYIGDFMSGFGDYATFLRQQRAQDLLADFEELPIRTVVRPTRFYYMLLQRLMDHRTMDDGIVWSAQADFMARLADWERDSDPGWPLQRAERAAVVELNVPYFVGASKGHEIHDAAGTSIQSPGTSGFDRACARVRDLDDDEIAWQLEVIRQNVGTLRRTTASGTTPRRLLSADSRPSAAVFGAEADAIAESLSRRAVRKGTGAAWIGLDWLGDSEVSQLVVLGPDLYNGACGIALFLSAHAAVTNDESSADLALAGVARLRESLRGRSSARTARSLGLGGGLGLGSIVYGFAVISVLLDDGDMLADSHTAAALITDEVIAADRQLDVLGGSAGAVLGLLRLYRQTGSADALGRAIACGRHLLAHDRVGPEGRRTWVAATGRPLNGMAHGAAGFAYALTSLASATGCDEFADAAAECIAFENAAFDAEHANWAYPGGNAGDILPCKWCYGAPGIGLARTAIKKHTALYDEVCDRDVTKALAGVERAWPAATDTLCCGTLGSIEFWWEAGALLSRSDLQERASRRLLDVVETARATGDYRWSSGTNRFNLGMFRGVAGAGYTALRRVDATLPNILIWE